MEVIQNFFASNQKDYFKANSKVIQIDSIQAQRKTLDRNEMNRLFQLTEKELPKGSILQLVGNSKNLR